MDGHGLLLLGEKHVGTVTVAEEDAIPRLVDVPRVNDVAVVADGPDGCLVDQVGKVSSRESRRGPCYRVEVHVRRKMLALDVDGQDGSPFGLIGQRDLDLTVESTRTQQGRVEDLGAVGGGHDHYPGGGVETVHLCQELVEGLLALVIGAEGRTSAPLADGVDL